MKLGQFNRGLIISVLYTVSMECIKCLGDFNVLVDTAFWRSEAMGIPPQSPLCWTRKAEHLASCNVSLNSRSYSQLFNVAYVEKIKDPGEEAMQCHVMIC